MQSMMRTHLFRHLDKFSASVQPCDLVAKGAEVLDVSARAAAEIQQAQRTILRKVPQERGPVLRDVVVLRSFPELYRAL